MILHVDIFGTPNYSLVTVTLYLLYLTLIWYYYSRWKLSSSFTVVIINVFLIRLYYLLILCPEKIFWCFSYFCQNILYIFLPIQQKLLQHNIVSSFYGGGVGSELEYISSSALQAWNLLKFFTNQEGN